MLDSWRIFQRRIYTSWKGVAGYQWEIFDHFQEPYFPFLQRLHFNFLPGLRLIRNCGSPTGGEVLPGTFCTLGIGSLNLVDVLGNHSFALGEFPLGRTQPKPGIRVNKGFSELVGPLSACLGELGQEGSPSQFSGKVAHVGNLGAL